MKAEGLKVLVHFKLAPGEIPGLACWKDMRDSWRRAELSEKIPCYTSQPPVDSSADHRDMSNPSGNQANLA